MSIMSESDTMFNKRGRRCAAAQLMLSTDQSYDNRTIASTLKMQIRTIQHAQGAENKFSGYGYGLLCGFNWGPHHATLHLRGRLESQHQSVPGCAEECGDPQLQSSGRWQSLGVAAGLSTGPQAQRDPGFIQKECYDFVTSSHWLPLPPTWTRRTTLYGQISRTSPTWPPTTPKSA